MSGPTPGRRWRHGRCSVCESVYRWSYMPRQLAGSGVAASETSDAQHTHERARCCGRSLRRIQPETYLKAPPTLRRAAPEFEPAREEIVRELLHAEGRR